MSLVSRDAKCLDLCLEFVTQVEMAFRICLDLVWNIWSIDTKTLNFIFAKNALNAETKSKNSSKFEKCAKNWKILQK